MLDKIGSFARRFYPGVIDSEQALEYSKEGHYSNETAADWLAEAAVREYQEENISDSDLMDYADAAVEVAEGRTPEAVFEDLDLTDLGPMGELIPNSPERDRSRDSMRQALDETSFDDYDIVVSAGGSSYSFADEIAEAADVDDVAIALERKDVEEENLPWPKRCDNTFYEVEHFFADNSVIEIVDHDIEGKDVLMVADQGTPDDDRNNLVQAVAGASDSYDHIDVSSLERGTIDL